MDAVRDLGRIEPWQVSLERSRARRASRRPRAPRRKAARWRILAAAVPGVFVLAWTVAVLPGALAGRGATAGPRAESRTVNPAYGGPLAARRVVSPAAGPRQAQRCQPVSGKTDYVNPLAGAHVKPERIDQGVDYAGSGNLEAIGAATVTRVTTIGTGWPGSFIEYRLLDGSDAGCYVYYAEGVNPAADLHVGQPVAAGQRIATIIPGWSTGIELGWGAGTSTTTYAAKQHQWSADHDLDSIASAAGKSFSALIASLGGPPGKVEG